MLIIGLAVYISERFEIVVTRSGNRQQDSTAARLENNLLFQKDKKCVQLTTLSKDQLKAEAGYVEFISTNEIPSSCLLEVWFQTRNDFDKDDRLGLRVVRFALRPAHCLKFTLTCTTMPPTTGYAWRSTMST